MYRARMICDEPTEWQDGLSSMDRCEELIARQATRAHGVSISAIESFDEIDPVDLDRECDAILVVSLGASPLEIAGRLSADTLNAPIVMWIPDDEDEALAADVMRLGVHDVVGGHDVDAVALSRALLRAIERNRHLGRADARFQGTLDSLTHDPMTKLPNRRMAREHVRLSLERAKRDGSELAVLAIDLDRFESINDSIGRSGGDAILAEAALRLSGRVRNSDLVARIGGDTFLVLLHDVDEEGCVGTVEEFLELLGSAHVIEGKEYWVTASIGVALGPRKTTASDSIVHHAEQAMRHARRAGGNRASFYNEEMHAAAERRSTIDQSLRRAFYSGGLELWYQPQVELATGSIIGAEALLRWRNPDVGWTSPDEFIRLAEESGLIVEIGRWALEEACGQLRSWIDRGWSDLRVMVNLSALQVQDESFVDTVASALTQTRCPPDRLELEITETALMTDEGAAFRVLLKLSRLGVSIALDDFGTGYSSLSSLQRFPIRAVKIDKSFVLRLDEESQAAAIVNAVLAIGRELGLRVVAEGIETPAQWDFLASRGCQHGQGYLFSRAVPAADFVALVESTRANGETP